MKNFLAFALNYQQWNVLKNSDYFGDCLVVTDSLRVAHELEKTGQTFYELTSLISRDEIERNDVESIRLVNNWYQPFLDHIEYEGVQLGRTMRRNMWYFFTAALNLLSATDQIFQMRCPEHFLVFDDYCDHTFWDTRKEPSVDHLNAILMYIAKQKKVEISKLSIHRSKKDNKLTNASRAKIQKTNNISAQHNISNYKKNSKHNVLTFLNSVDYIEQYLLLENLDAIPDTNYVILKNGEFKTKEYNLTILDWKNLVSFEKTRQYENIHVLNAVLNKRWKKFKQSQKQKKSDYPEIFNNSYLDFQFRAYWKSLLKGAHFINTWKLLCSYFDPVLCIFGTDFEGKVRCLIQTTKLLGITALTIPHGSGIGRCGRYEMRVSDSDYITTIGSFHSSLIKEIGNSDQNIVETGSLHYGNQINTISDSEDDPCKPVNNYRIVVFTALANYGLSLCQVDLKEHRENLNAFAKLALKRSDLEIMLKPHPRYDYHEYYEYLKKISQQSLQIIRDRNFKQLMSGDVIAVLYNVPSSVYIDVITAGVPIIYYKSSGYDTPSLKSTLDKNDVFCIHSIRELETAIDRMTQDNRFRNELLWINKSFLKRIIFNSPHIALKKIIGLIKELINKSTLTKQKSFAVNNAETMLSLLTALNISADLNIKPLNAFYNTTKASSTFNNNCRKRSFGTIYLNAADKAYISKKYLLAYKLAAQALSKNPSIIKTVIYKVIDKVALRF